MTQEISGVGHRIALVTGVLDLGGTTTFMCNLAGELVRRGVAVQVFSFEQDNPLSEDFRRLSVPVFTTNQHRFIYEDRLDLILRELARFKPTVAVANLSSASFEVLRYLPPGVFRFGTAQSHDPGVYANVRPYARFLDAMAAVSQTIRATLATLPEFARVPIHYLPYGVPMPHQEPQVSAQPGFPLRILYLGRLQREQKRVQLFPQILRSLEAAEVPFHWTIAGSGPEEQFLRQNMGTSRPGQSVYFTGKVLYGDVPRLLSDHVVFLLASDYEGLPLSLLEAMGHGLVPVVSDLASGIREVVDDSTGKRVPPEQVNGYAEAIIWLFRHPEESRRLSQSARTKVQCEFSASAMTDRWLGTLPPPPRAQIEWPQQWRVVPILVAPNPWIFSRPARVLRRALLELWSLRPRRVQNDCGAASLQR